MNVIHRIAAAYACRVLRFAAVRGWDTPEWLRALARDGMVHVHGPLILDPQVEISPALAFDLLRSTAKVLPHRSRPYQPPWADLKQSGSDGKGA